MAKIFFFFILITISDYEIEKKVDNVKEDENVGKNKERSKLSSLQ